MKPTKRTRRALTVVCIALIVFAGLVPAASPLFAAILTPLWLVVPAVVVTIVRRRATRSDAQPVSLLSAGLFRAPPLPLV